MTEKLLPCPFCGTSDIACCRNEDDNGILRGFVMCEGCGAECSDHDTLPEASCVDAWNRRVQAARVDSTEAQLSSSLFETLERIAVFLEIDLEAAKKAPGKPSDVYIAAIREFALRAPQARQLTEGRQR